MPSGLLSGWLRKRGGGHWSKDYKQRWFVLRDDASVCYYKIPPTGPSVKPQGQFSLVGAKVDASGETSIEVHATTPHRTFHIEAESTSSRNRWANAMESAAQGETSFDWANSTRRVAEPDYDETTEGTEEGPADTTPEVGLAPDGYRWYDNPDGGKDSDDEDNGAELPDSPSQQQQQLGDFAISAVPPVAFVPPDASRSVLGLPPGVVVIAQSGVDHNRLSRLDNLDRLDRLDALDRREANQRVLDQQIAEDARAARLGACEHVEL